MVKSFLATLFLIAFTCVGQAQKFSKLPENMISDKETAMHLRFLASDEMLGRKTGEQGCNVAARYIAEQFRLLGVQPVSGQTDYFQPVAFEKISPIESASIILSTGDTLKNLEDFVVSSGSNIHQKKETVFIPYGATEEDYQGVDVKDKIVVVQFGKANTTNFMDGFSALKEKRTLATQKGALALVEIFTAQVPWKNMANYLSSERIILARKDKYVPYILINGAKAAAFSKDKMSSITLNLGKRKEINFNSQNVVGVLEGTDPVLKNEYIILSAHFDHVGVGKKTAETQDTIFNGSRDNAFGVSAILFAAKSFSQIRPKRSILFIGFTGEEIGLLGSEYYAKNPLIPLNKCVYNLNCDGAGYNDTKLLTTIGLSRTDCKAELEAAAAKYGLAIKDDPAPEQNLFDRSDNVSFAAKGIPSPTFSPGFTAFDDALFKFYHQVTDNPDSIDFTYLHKYCQVYAYGARLIANRKTQPKWVGGDKYEAAYKTLYGVK